MRKIMAATFGSAFDTMIAISSGVGMVAVKCVPHGQVPDELLVL